MLDAYFEDFIENIVYKSIVDNVFCLPMNFCEKIEKLKQKAVKENISVTIHKRSNEHYSTIECIFVDRCSHKTRNLQISYSPVFDNKIFRFFHTYNGNNENTLRILERITNEKNSYLSRAGLNENK